VETGQSFYYFILWEMTVALFHTQERGGNAEWFWEKHANYEAFASVESIPSRQEITELANDLLIEAEEAAAGDFIKKNIPPMDFRLLQERTADGRCLLIDKSGNLGLGLVPHSLAILWLSSGTQGLPSF
jgi:hypothetical protein